MGNMLMVVMQFGGSAIKVGEEEYSIFRDHEYDCTIRMVLEIVLADMLQLPGEDQRVDHATLQSVPIPRWAAGKNGHSCILSALPCGSSRLVLQVVYIYISPPIHDQDNCTL